MTSKLVYVTLLKQSTLQTMASFTQQVLETNTSFTKQAPSSEGAFAVVQ